MRRSPLILLAGLQLCRARSPGFSIHEDLLTFPQFEVVFADEYISEKDALALLERHDQHPTYSAEFAQSTLEQVREADDQDEDDVNGRGATPSYTYEVMKMTPNQYLCSIPVLQPPAPENKTANELAMAEEARELSRATASGWELVTQLENSCLYFMYGWWTYSFCNNHEIVQFHALPSMPNGQPPKRDPQTAAYVLGQTPTLPPAAAYQAKKKGEQAPSPAELQVNGDQRYLVQRLEGGTICDLTGRDRTIEVQYHCAPGLKNDRIAWIKEVTICAYLMVIHTPRLCNDVAFLPPEETRANAIRCQLIVNEDATPPLLEEKAPSEEPDADAEGQPEQETAAADNTALEKERLNVGGVIVGARRVLSGADEAGKPPAKLHPPRSYFANTDVDTERFIEVVAQGAARENGGAVKVLTKEELELLGLQAKVVQEMSAQMQELAAEHGWKLELVELPGGDRELRGYIDADEEEVPKEKGTDEGQELVKEKGEKVDKKVDQKIEERPEGKAEDKSEKKEEEHVQGSEEKFFGKKEEL